MSKLIRITQETQQNLDIFSKMVGKSKQSIVENAIDHYLREQFLALTNCEYEKLRSNP